jgi:hypothetical protein
MSFTPIMNVSSCYFNCCSVSVKSPRKGTAGHRPGCPAKKSKYVRCRDLTEEHIHGIANRIPECLIRHTEAGGIGAFNCVYEPPCQAWMFPFKFRKVINHIPGIIQVEIFPAHVADGKIDYEIHQKGTVLFEFHFYKPSLTWYPRTVFPLPILSLSRTRSYS